VCVTEKGPDGWYIGTNITTGITGTFPGNFVVQLDTAPEVCCERVVWYIFKSCIQRTGIVHPLNTAFFFRIFRATRRWRANYKRRSGNKRRRAAQRYVSQSGARSPPFYRGGASCSLPSSALLSLPKPLYLARGRQ
jgi:hypothetical protein